MPFHAFLSVWLGSFTHHQAVIQSWKEVLLVVLSALAASLLVSSPQARDRLRTWPVILAGAFALVASTVTLFSHASLTAVAFGAKTDFEFLVAFVLAVIASSAIIMRRLTWAILVPAAIVVGFGILQVTTLPADFLTHFGYGPATIQPFLVLDPAIGSLRFSSTLGGPNQLGTYLLLPMALAAIIAIRKRYWWLLAIPVLGLIPLLHTYSRAAWLGAVATALVVLALVTPRRLLAWLAGVVALCGIVAALLTDQLLKSGGNFQYYLLHSSLKWNSLRGSDFEHLNSLRTGVSETLAQPLGHGLGSAGPAVFHSGSGAVIESNYLQLSYESGLAGLALFVGILVSLAFELGRRAAANDIAAATLATLTGMCVTCIFLPSWTDSSTALIFWIAAGTVVGLSPETRRV